jgi:hypothetical protein
LEKLNKEQVIDFQYQPFGNGYAAKKIREIIKEWSKNRN